MTITDNLAKAAIVQGVYNLTVQTIFNGASSISLKTTLVGNATLYIQASVPEGKKLVVFDRTIEAQTGLYAIDVCGVTSYTGGTTAGVVRRALAKGSTPVDTIIRTGVTPVGLVVLEYGLQDNGTASGQSRPTGAPSVSGALTTITGDNNVIRIVRTGSGNAELVFRLLCWETDI
jgi:hypothetical protein